MAKFPKTLLLVSSVKIQYVRDDEGPHSCINQNKNIDNDLYCSSNEFPNHLALLTMVLVTSLLNHPPPPPDDLDDDEDIDMDL